MYKRDEGADGDEIRWLLLIHQIPPRPNYLRVKIGRQLQRIGAVPIKNSVYVLPRNSQAQEDFQWVLREVVEGGGDATLIEARFIDGLCDDQVQALFNAARDEAYRQVEEDARQLLERSASGVLGDVDLLRGLEPELNRLRRQVAEIAALDFFGAPGRTSVEGVLDRIEVVLHPPAQGVPAESCPTAVYQGRTWVTRTGVHIDRIASAWLIQRFIDPAATFQFVAHKGYQPDAGVLRFDMFDAEFTHVGDRCTFEVLLERTGPHEAALVAIAEIVHDIDLKDEKFGRPEAHGIASLIAGLAMAHPKDAERLERGFAIFDDLLEYFRRHSPG